MSTETLETRVANRISALVSALAGVNIATPGELCTVTVEAVAGIVRDELRLALETAPTSTMTNEQFEAELSPEYREWTTGPSLDISGPVEEIQRLCEVIVGLRARVVELESESEKKKHGHRGLVGELETTRTKLRLAEGSVAELEGARAKAIEGAAPEFSEFERLARKYADWAHADRELFLVLISELDRRADVIAAQAAARAKADQDYERLTRMHTQICELSAERYRTVKVQAAELERLRKDLAFGKEAAQEGGRAFLQAAGLDQPGPVQAARNTISVGDLAKMIKAAEEHRVRSSGRAQATLSPDGEAFQWQGYLLCASVAIEAITITQRADRAHAQAEPQDCGEEAPR